MQESPPIIIDKKREAILVPLQLIGGGVGGLAQYYSVIRAVPPDASVAVFSFMGAIAGTIGVTVVAAKLKQNLSLRHNFVGAIATGFAFDPILKGLVAVLSLQSQVQRLESANLTAQYDHISTLSEVAELEDPALRKRKIINEINEIAVETNDFEIKEKAISAVDETAQISNREIKLSTIRDLKRLALNTNDPQIRRQIIVDLRGYTTEHSQVVIDAANQALAEIN